MAGFLEREFLGNSVLSYLLSAGILVIGSLLIRFVLRRFILEQLRQRLASSNLLLGDTLIQIAEQYLIPFLYVILIYFCLDSLVLNDPISRGVEIIATILATFLGINLLSATLEYFLQVYMVRRRGPHTEHIVEQLSPLIRIVFAVIGLLFLLDNLGFNIASLVASLGIGGVAIALASQGVLEDLFSYFSILFDRPFELGDFISIGEFMGTVEHIGIKTTRLNGLDGEQQILANTDITSSRIRNYGRMERRRIVFQIGVTYSTPQEQLHQIPQLLEEIVRSTDNTAFDRAHFSQYGDFSLNFEVVYYVTSPSYTVYMDAQQTINLAIGQAFESRGIEIAFPTQVLYLNSSIPEAGSDHQKMGSAQG